MSAIFSSCKKHRYRLERIVQDQGQVVAFFGINPSMADNIENDPTVKKWMVFASQINACKFIVGNMFSYITPYVDELAECNDLINTENESYLDSIIDDADILIACWGSREKVPSTLYPYFDQLMLKLKNSNKPLYCFGYTKSGDPRHVSRLAYTTPLLQIK